MPDNQRKELALALSPCPNDTFIFEALINGRTAFKDYSVRPFFHDIENLNQKAFSAHYPVSKLSFAAFASLQDKYLLLKSGAALGRACGPLLVARDFISGEKLLKGRIAVPGLKTTAVFLLKCFLGKDLNLLPLPFDQIAAAVENRVCEAGLLIHEARFSYQESGLVCIQDLGVFWEEEMGLPLPLGAVFLRRDMAFLAEDLNRAIRESLVYARSYPEQALLYAKKYAQDMRVDILKKHIDLYVNDYSLELGEEGERAVYAFLEKAESLAFF